MDNSFADQQDFQYSQNAIPKRTKIHHFALQNCWQALLEGRLFHIFNRENCSSLLSICLSSFVVCKVPCNEKNKTLPHLWGTRDAQNGPVRFTGRRIRREGKHRVVCAEWDLLSQLWKFLQSCLEQSKAQGPASFRLLLGRARETNERRLEAKCGFFPLKVRLFQVPWASWRLCCTQAQRAFHTGQTSPLSFSARWETLWFGF